jgi:hypothetical protein
METEKSFSRLEEAATGTCLEPDESNAHSYILFL